METQADVGRVRGRPSEGAREALVEAARQLFMAADYEQVSTEQILERSGVSRGALYHHFPSKLELFTAVYEATERRHIEAIGAEMAAAESPFDALLLGASAYLRRCESDEEMRRIGLMQSRAVLGWERWREVAMGLGLGAVLAAVSAAIEAEELPPHDPETLAVIVLGALIEAAMPIAVAADRRAARRRSEAVIADLLEGLRR